MALGESSVDELIRPSDSEGRRGVVSVEARSSDSSTAELDHDADEKVNDVKLGESCGFGWQLGQ